MAFEDSFLSSLKHCFLYMGVFAFDVHIFRAQSYLTLSPLLLSLLILSAGRISQDLLYMKCSANLNLSSEIRLSLALSFFPLLLVDLQVSIYLCLGKASVEIGIFLMKIQINTTVMPTPISNVKSEPGWKLFLVLQ